MDQKRDIALDCTKGIAILAVVLFHVTRGYSSAGLLTETVPLRFADTLAYGFHVQSFFLIAGYLSFPRADGWRFQLRRQVSLYHAYLLWSVVSWLLSAAFAGQVNSAMDWQALMRIPVEPIQHFWFLLALMAGTALIGLLRTPALLLGATALCLGLHGTGVGGYFLSYFPFIFIGAWLRQSGQHPPANLIAGALCLLAIGLGAWTATVNGRQLGYASAFPLMLAGCYAAYVGGSLAARSGGVGALLAMLGRHSLPIYLLHVIAGAGTRILLGHAAPGLPVPIAVTISLAAAIGLPLLADLVARRLGLAALAGFAPLPLFRAPSRPALA